MSMSHSGPPRHVVVVGGGITGLAAALAICDRTAHLTVPTRVTVLELSGRFGGKLHGGTLDWDGQSCSVEFGADALLTRVPEGMGLIERLGLGSELVYPRTGQAHIALADGLHVLPPETVLGVPTSPGALTEVGLVSDTGAVRMLAEPNTPGEPVIDDIGVGTLVRRRLGDEVAENVVEPLLGGVYAGDSDALSLQATIPALAAELRKQPSLIRAAAVVHARRTGTGPAFATVRGGVSRLVLELERVLRSMRADGQPRVVLRCNAAVRELHRAAVGWELTLGPASQSEALHADAVLLATPTPTTRRLLEETSPAAAVELAEIEYASVAVINLVLPHVALPSGSGVLVPSVAGRTVKAVTFVDQKWQRDAPEVRLLRVSVGRYGDDATHATLQREDADLIEVISAELAQVLGPLPTPLATHVQRWGGALPQYLVGHPARVRRARERVASAGGLALAGAGYDGVGVAACISSAYRAADALTAVAGGSAEGEQR